MTGAKDAEAAPPASQAPVPKTSPDLIASEDDHIVPEEDLDDSESLGGETSSYTTSLASSVINYPVEYGRRFHAYQHGRYTRPNDEMEMERLSMVHQMVTTAIGGLYLAPVDREKEQRILDIGTGPGIWAIEIADLFPTSTIIGNDLSANMPAFVPPNVRFEVDDIESDWVHDDKFTWIFSRYMAASIGDWPKLIGNYYDNLVPGGWVELQDFNLEYYSEDDSLNEQTALGYWIKVVFAAVREIGRDPSPGSKLESMAKDAGFTNLVHKRYKLPVGTWAKDPALKEIGLLNYMQITQGIEGLSQRLFTQVLKWKHEDMVELLKKVRQDLSSPNIHSILDLHVVYGQKPE